MTNDALVLPDDAHNRELVSHVHPSGWQNPRPAGRYNLVVIGGGTAGLVCAAGAAGLGAKVALIERHLLGGDCLNFGCVPSKALLRAAQAAYAARNATQFGVAGEEAPSVDFASVMARLRMLRAQISHHDSAERFRELGVDVFLGGGRFVAPNAVEVDGERLSFHRAVIATGARAAIPPIPGLRESNPLTNETLFSLVELPPRLLIIGAGPIGCEMAQAFVRFGSRVTLLDRADRVMSREDPDASEVVRARLEVEGVELVLGANILRVETRAAGPSIVIESEAGERTFEGDAILVASGREPNIDGLALEVAGVSHHPKGVVVDERLRTTNSRVYAAGDICSPYQFTHTADAMARIVLQNALFFGRKKTSDLVIPWATYTTPEVAHVGMTSEQASEAGASVKTLTVQMSAVDRALLEGDTEGFARVHVHSRSGRVLGATLVSAHAGESIGEMALAITSGQKLSDIARTIHPYPTQSEAWKKLGDAWMRTKLTPLVARLLRRFLALFAK